MRVLQSLLSISDLSPTGNLTVKMSRSLKGIANFEIYGIHSFNCEIYSVSVI